MSTLPTPCVLEVKDALEVLQVHLRRWRQRAAWLVLAAAVSGAVVQDASAQTQPLPSDCSSTNLASCHYMPPRVYAVGEVDMVMIDLNRSGHVIPFRVRYPIGATGPLPVVFWNHGGGTTTITHWVAPATPVSHGQTGSERRSRSFAAAGYVVIHIGRLPVSDLVVTPGQLDDCRRIGVQLLARLDGNPLTDPRTQCREFIGWNLYGPQNVAYVASRLDTVQARMPGNFRGTLDREKLVVGGWSGGTQSVLNIAGAGQRWAPLWPHTVGLEQPAVAVPGVVAFIADAPRRPGFIEGGDESGFDADALFRIGSQPFLFNTGKADTRPGDTTPTTARVLPWISAQPGGKVLAWDRTGLADHSTVNVEDAGCVPGTGQVELCLGYAELGLAFLDAAVKMQPAAIQWIGSDALHVLLGRKIELHRR
jgi:hypothetical protein